MSRTRKQPVVSEVSVPQVLITRDQYFQDIKVRWQIHQYEVNKLVEDVKKALDYSVGLYQQLRAKYASQ